MPALLGGEALKGHLSALLPRMRRFALVVAGDAANGDALLRLACDAMLAEPERRRTDMPLDRWAFSQIYAMWMDELRGRREPMSQSRADEELLRDTFAAWGADETEASELAGFLAGLPPQQRAAALLVYGEDMTYEEAALVLDAPEETVAARAARALSDLVERLGLQPPETPVADEEPVYLEQEQAAAS